MGCSLFELGRDLLVVGREAIGEGGEGVGGFTGRRAAIVASWNVSFGRGEVFTEVASSSSSEEAQCVSGFGDAADRDEGLLRGGRLKRIDPIALVS